MASHFGHGTFLKPSHKGQTLDATSSVESSASVDAAATVDDVSSADGVLSVDSSSPIEFPPMFRVDSSASTTEFHQR